MLSAHRVNVTLGSTHILHDITCSVEKGEWIGLLGPNGSGKSTLLRAIGGLVSYTGTLCVDDQEVRTYSPQQLAQRLAFVQQNLQVGFDFTVKDLVLLGRAPYKRWFDPYGAEDYKRVETALYQLDLGGFENRSITELSGGEQQLVFLAQALVQEADLLLLDEPTNHLDIHHQHQLLHQIRELVNQQHTVITAFHDLNLAARYTDRVFVVENGQLAATGPPEEVLTETLIASVFQVVASVTTETDGYLNIRFHMPV